MSAELQHQLRMAGTPVYLGTIVATTTKNNHDTATPFNNTGRGLAGKTVVLQADAACHVAYGTTNAVTVTTGNGFALAAGQSVSHRMVGDYGWIAVVGTANVKVFELVAE